MSSTWLNSPFSYIPRQSEWKKALKKWLLPALDELILLFFASCVCICRGNAFVFFFFFLGGCHYYLPRELLATPAVSSVGRRTRLLLRPTSSNYWFFSSKSFQKHFHFVFSTTKVTFKKIRKTTKKKNLPWMPYCPLALTIYLQSSNASSLTSDDLHPRLVHPQGILQVNRGDSHLQVPVVRQVTSHHHSTYRYTTD